MKYSHTLTDNRIFGYANFTTTNFTLDSCAAVRATYSSKANDGRRGP